MNTLAIWTAAGVGLMLMTCVAQGQTFRNLDFEEVSTNRVTYFDFMLPFFTGAGPAEDLIPGWIFTRQGHPWGFVYYNYLHPSDSYGVLRRENKEQSEYYFPNGFEGKYGFALDVSGVVYVLSQRGRIPIDASRIRLHASHPLIGSYAPVDVRVNGLALDDGDVSAFAGQVVDLSLRIFGTRVGIDRLEFERRMDATWSLVYSNDFESDVGFDWGLGPPNQYLLRTPVGNRGYLGRFPPDAPQFQHKGLPPHSEAMVSFDLFVLGPWAGSNDLSDTNDFSSDSWTIVVDRKQVLLLTSFSNTRDRRQSYPGSVPLDRYPSWTGASETNTLGFRFPHPDVGELFDSVYPLNFRFRHTSDVIHIILSHYGLASVVWGPNQWGIDNFKLWLNTNVVSNPVSPNLEVEAVFPQQAVLRWSNQPAASFRLLSTTNLAPPILWLPATNAVRNEGTHSAVTIEASGTQGFYRLRAVDTGGGGAARVK